MHSRAMLISSAFLAVSLPAQAPLAPLDGQGVSIELARARATSISGVRYDLTLDISSVDRAAGQVRVRFDRTDRNDLILDFRGRDVSRISSNGTAVPVSEFNGHHIRIPAASLRTGENVVEVSFTSEIAPSGASIIRSKDLSDGSDYLYTLLVPADANQLFPCFDQPDLKARISLTLVAPRAWTVIANGSVTRADTMESTVRTSFTETRPLSTYLIAFAAGPWSRFSSTADGRTINLYARRSRAKEVDADTLLALSHRSLVWMERYFGQPYPFEKFDLLLSPAFPFGGMEHPGLVMYNEDRFVFRDRPTLARRVGRFNTILHETAHQWFGDFVTMRWFDDLWLKEGFATYMGAKALAELEPDADAWKTFYQGNKPSAYGVDQTLGTTPLWQTLGNLDQAKSAYGAIVYNKAPSVLKQLNYLVGDAAFQRGVRTFLTRHSYANATWQDLLAAIGGASGKPLDAFGASFMLRPGMPVIEPVLDIRNGTIERLKLVQAPAQVAVSGQGAWPMRTRVLLAYADRASERLDVDLTGIETDVVAARGKPAPAFVFPNVDDFGYFLSLLDSASVRALENGALGSIPDPLLRSMLWGSLWDEVRAARYSPVRFARLTLRELPAESDEQIIPGLTSRLDRVVRAYIPGAAADSIRRDAEAVLWTGLTDTRRTFGVRRGMLDAFIGIAASGQGRTRMKQLLVADSAAGEPMRDPTRWAIVDRLLVLDDPEASTLLERQAARDTSVDGRRRAFIAGAARQSADQKADYFRRYFADRALNEDWASGSLGVFNAVEHQALTLRYLRAALDSLPYIQRNRRIFFLGAWLSAFLGGQTSQAAAQIVTDWLAAHPNLPLDLRQKVLQNSDELHRTVRIRRMAVAGVR